MAAPGSSRGHAEARWAREHCQPEDGTSPPCSCHPLRASSTPPWALQAMWPPALNWAISGHRTQIKQSTALWAHEGHKGVAAEEQPAGAFAAWNYAPRVPACIGLIAAPPFPAADLLHILHLRPF